MTNFEHLHDIIRNIYTRSLLQGGRKLMIIMILGIVRFKVAQLMPNV